MDTIVAAAPQIPPEIVDQILDYLWVDQSTLRSCSLSCRSWLPTSRYHLFATICIKSQSNFDRFRDLLTTSESSLLPSEVHPMEYVRSIRFERYIPFCNDFGLRSAAAYSRLRNVRHVQLSYWSPLRQPDPVIQGFHSSFPHLTSIDLVHVILHSEALFSLLFGFPQLTRLRIRDLKSFGETSLASFHYPAEDAPVPREWENPKNQLVAVADGENYIRDVDLLLATYAASVISRLQRSPLYHRLRLRSLRVMWRVSDDEDDWGRLREVFKSIGSSLEILQFIISDEDHMGDVRIPELFDALQMDHLRFLDIGPVMMDSDTFPSSAQLAWVVPLLSHVQQRAPKLAKLRLSLNPSCVEELDRLDWPAVEQSLLSIMRSRPRMLLLCTVHMMSGDAWRQGGHTLKGLSALLMQRLSQLFTEGLANRAFRFIYKEEYSLVHMLTTSRHLRT